LLYYKKLISLLRFSAPTLGAEVRQQNALKCDNRMRWSATTNCFLIVTLSNDRWWIYGKFI